MRKKGDRSAQTRTDCIRRRTGIASVLLNPEPSNHSTCNDPWRRLPGDQFVSVIFIHPLHTFCPRRYYGCPQKNTLRCSRVSCLYKYGAGGWNLAKKITWRSYFGMLSRLKLMFERRFGLCPGTFAWSHDTFMPRDDTLGAFRYQK